MKYLKIATTLLLLVAVVANFTFAGNVKTTGSLPLPQRDSSPDRVVKANRTAPTSLRGVVQEPNVMVPYNVEKDKNRRAILSKSGIEIPKEILSGGLSGTFHIGTANQFKTIADMAFLMNIANISGPVTFLLDDASYSEAGVAIGGSPGASATNTITIRPNTGNTACSITLTNVHANGGGLVFSGANYVTVEGTALGQPAGSRNLAIQLSASPSSAQGGDAPVRLTNCAYTTIADCNITGNSPSAVMSNDGLANGNASVSINATAGLYNDHLTITNNDLHGGHFGVLEMGNFMKSFASYGNQDRYTTISNNWIHDVTENGMKLYQVSHATVTGNTVKRVVLGSGAGAAWILNFPSVGGSPNTVGTAGNNWDLPLWYRASGISVWGDFAVVANNLVDSIISNRSSAGTGSATVYGIRVCGFGANDPASVWGGGESMAGVTSGSIVKNNIVTRVHCRNAVQANGIRYASMGIAMEVGRWDTCVYNTVYMSGNGAGANPTGTTAFYLGGVAPTSVTGAGGQGYLSAWFGNGAYLTSTIFSYRVIVTDNIFAVNRTGGASDNAVMAISNAGGVFDIRPSSDNNVLYMGSSGVVQAEISGKDKVSLYDYQQAQAGGGFVTDANSQADDPTLTSESDVNINPAGLSTADGNGKVYAAVTTDYAGVTRGTPSDIGALEGTGAGHPHDTKMNALTSPGAAGVPQGLPVASFSLNALNLGGFAETGVPVTVHVVAPSSASQDFTGSFDAAAGGFVSFDVNGPWTPSESGTYSLTIYCNLATDNYRSNDTIHATIPVNGQKTVPYTSGFEDASQTSGWFADGQFAVGTTGGKLGGPHGGTKYYVTNPGSAGNGITDKTVSTLVTPFFDLSSTSSATISFYHSINTEPSWDRSIVQYSIDTGKTWQTLGTLNDADGVNWYSTSVYSNAAGDETNCWDEATATTLGFPSDNPGVMPPAQFSSNGNCLTDSPNLTRAPNGYVLVALKLDNIPAPVSPLLKSFVRFRYVTFTDAGTHGDGWAVDDFSLGAAVSGANANYGGVVYNDVTGNGTMDGGDTGIDGVTVTLTYFGAPVHTTVTAGGGIYLFDTLATNGMNLPGVYNVTTNGTGALSQSPADFSHASELTGQSGKNVGFYTGSISGKVYNDVNNNGANDAEGGLSGFTVSVHKDSLTGASAGSAVTAADGNYTFNLLPATYVVSVSSSSQYRGTQTANYTVTVSGNGGSGTAVYTGKDFGFFKYATERVTATLDQNGNGTVDVTDIAVLPSGVFAAFTLKKNGSTVRVDTIGSGTKEYAVSGLDTGSYSVEVNVGAPDQAGYLITSSTSRSFSVTTSGTLDTSKFLWFKKASVSGTVYGDADGSGAKNGGEAGVAGWVVKIDGTPADTSDGSGLWSVSTALTPGSHTVSLTSQAGYSYTQGSSNYTFSPNSGSSTTARDFGVFAQFSISGSAYRDRDNNAAKNGADDALAGVIVSLSKNGSAAGTDTTDSNGDFSFAANGPGAYVVSAEAPSGYGQTAPESTYAVAGTSGVNSTSSVFGFFHLTDSVKYRTITAADIVAGGKVKPSVNAKKDTVGNFANLLNDQVANTYVGIVGTAKAAGAYMQPAKYSDVQASTGADGKSAAHSGTPSGLDFSAKGKVLGGRYKALKSSVQDNVLFANLLALRINIAASEHGTTPAGFSSLIINDGSEFDGMTISAFATKCDSLMTFWKKIPQSTYDAANTLAANINSAFNAPFDFDQAAFRADGKIHMTGAATVYDVEFLLPASKIVPKTPAPPAGQEAPIPTVYALYQNYPNPFNPTTNIRFDLPMASTVTVKIYNMIGQEVATLFNHEQMDAGQVEASFNAASLASGVYFYRVTAEGVNADGLTTGDTFSKVMKMALVK